LIASNNSELLANLGNFVNRLIKFVNAKLGGVIPEFSATYEDETFDFPGFIAEVNALRAEYVADMEAVRLRAGLKKLMEISAKGNLILAGRLDNANLTGTPTRTHTIIGLALNLTYLLASLSSPFMPSIATSITEQLNAPLLSIPDQWSPGALASGHKIGKAAYLFTKIPEEKEEEWRNKYGGTQASRLAEEEAKAKKAADKARDKERKKAKKEAAAKAFADAQKNPEAKTEQKEEKKSIEATGEKVELPLRGAVAEEEAPPPAAAP
jgi:methionyl-tRNA synthetase